MRVAWKQPGPAGPGHGNDAPVSSTAYHIKHFDQALMGAARVPQKSLGSVGAECLTNRNAISCSTSFASTRHVQVPPRLNYLLMSGRRGDGRGSEQGTRSLPAQPAWGGVGVAGRQRRMSRTLSHSSRMRSGRWCQRHYSDPPRRPQGTRAQIRSWK